MTDIFVNRNPAPPKGRIVFIGIAVLVVIGLGVWAFLSMVPKGTPVGAPQAEPAPAEQAAAPATTTPPASGEPKAPAPTPAPPMATALPDPGVDSSAALLEEARKLKAADDFQGAREKALAAREQTRSDAVLDASRDLLGEVDIGLLFSERAMPEKIDYTIAAGDTLAKLATRYGTTLELISKGNNIKGPTIRVGDRLRIFTGKFSIRVNKGMNVLDLYMNDTFFKRYRVGTGQYSKTPTGTFKITDRVAQPTWWRDDGKAIPFGDKENLLGTHWLSLDIKGYGIHGTWEPDTIGKQSSAGCIRLLNEDIEQLYTLVPIGTPVTIED